MHIINKGSTFNPIVMDALHRMFWLSALFNFKLTARHISGQCNIIADAISRIHEFKYLMYFYHILQGLYPPSLLHDMPSGKHIYNTFPISFLYFPELAKALKYEVYYFRLLLFSENTEKAYRTHRDSFCVFVYTWNIHHFQLHRTLFANILHF